jgi:hypothetical protein
MRKKAEEETAADPLPSLGDDVVDVPLEREIDVIMIPTQVSIRVSANYNYVI